MSVWGYVYLNAVALRGQKRAVDPVELESQVVLSSLMGMLGTKLRSSKAVSANRLQRLSLHPSHLSGLDVYYVHIFSSGNSPL